MIKRKFYIAKVNIHGNIFSQNLDELISYHIPRVLLNPVPIKIHTWNWSFTDVEQINYEGHNLIIGNVTKSKRKPQKYKLGSKTFVETSENELAETAFFVYDAKSELLVHESNASISAFEFRNFFTNLLSNDSYVGDVRINPIPIPFKIKDELISYDKVTKISFHLIHPNPGPGREEFNLYNKIIHDSHLKELDIEMKNKDGINIYVSNSTYNPTFTEVIEDGITLVERGYGDIDISGYNEYTIQGKKKPRIERKNKNFKSRNSVKQINIIENDRDTIISRIFHFMRNTISKS
ncbi:hypothetical protein [Heyndrickxia acidicola]|uniref:Uncharacterized protein n=1 Tax=Heyndrickxia acidicola TaxID=209389 RepID=A0ABU6MBD2_9BACI|nr:hypothetical protein [Heyndrickxia acidicola]MED1201986.1 hypothetical protein [Heyndrickxia acidicola]